MTTSTRPPCFSRTPTSERATSTRTGRDEDFDELSIEELFLNVTAMWSVLGAIDSDDRLTPLGWWGLPEAMSRAWTESEAE